MAPFFTLRITKRNDSLLDLSIEQLNPRYLEKVTVQKKIFFRAAAGSVPRSWVGRRLHRCPLGLRVTIMCVRRGGVEGVRWLQDSVL